jgi:transcriptional regulator with XRE-family HTH domain
LKSLRSPAHLELRQRLITARNEAGLNQEQLGQKLRRHQTFITKYETGERRLEVIEFAQICMLIGVLPEELIKDLVHYPRTELAEQIADALQGKDPFGDAHNGLFLAAPRGTGKSTFLQADLKPALKRRGITVVYVDFWANPPRDPRELLAEALGRAIAPRLGLISKLAAKRRLAKLTVNGLEFDLTKIGRSDGVSIPDALQTLQTAVKKPVALILDEAQHALSSKAGEAAMMALKSARDQMNGPGKVRLMLVLSGSDGYKLLRLVKTRAAPFFGSQITPMPTLGADFVEHIAALIERQRPELTPIDRSVLFEAFQAFGARPQFFLDALGHMLSPLENGTERPEAAVLAQARQHEQDEHWQTESDYLSLRPIEQAVLWRMLEQGPRFRPYDSESNEFYAKVLGRRIKKARVQAALESLCDRSPPMIGKSALGEYAIEDAALHAWFKSRRKTNSGPPTGTAP